MKSLIVFDSQYGNTEKIAREIAKILQSFGSARLVRVTDVTPNALEGVDLLVVGSPTQAWNSTGAMKDFFAHLNPPITNSVFAAAFDTRFDKPRLLTGSAAYAMAKELKRRGALMLLKPECFLVTGTEGPLVEGELEHAAAWARALHAEFELQAEPLVVTI